MAKYVLTVTSKSGKKVNQISGGPSDSVAVYSDADLKKRLKTSKKNPDLKVDVRKAGS